MTSYGDEVYINDLGIKKKISRPEDGESQIHLVEEEDGSINWYLLPNHREDRILVTRGIDLTEEEKKELKIE